MPIAIQTTGEAVVPAAFLPRPGEEALGRVGPSVGSPWEVSLDPPELDPPGSEEEPPLDLGIGGFGSLNEVLFRTCHVFTLETWRLSGVASPDELYLWRAVNNGRSAVWARSAGLLEGEASSPPQLHAVWVDPEGAVRLRIFDEEVCGWVGDYRSSTTFDAGAAVRWPGLVAHESGGLAEPTTSVSWLELADSDPMGTDHIVVRVDLPFAAWLDLAPRGEVERIAASPGRAEKYLTGALLEDRLLYGLTEQWPPDQLPDPNASRDRRAYQVEAGQVDSLRVDAGSDRASDPTVDASPDGSSAVVVWEEGKDGEGYALAFRAVRLQSGSLVADGSFWVVGESGDPLYGGDPSVCVLEEWIYVAYQSVSGGGTWLYRTARKSSYDGSERWSPVRDPESPVSHGYLGDGFLANVSGITRDGVDYLAVAWENGPGSLGDNENKTVEYVCVRASGRSFEITRRENLGTYRHGVYATVGELFACRCQMSPSVVVSEQAGEIAVDLFLFEVDFDPTASEGTAGDAQIDLVHRAWWFEGGCRCGGVVVAVEAGAGGVKAL